MWIWGFPLIKWGSFSNKSFYFHRILMFVVSLIFPILNFFYFSQAWLNCTHVSIFIHNCSAQCSILLKPLAPTVKLEPVWDFLSGLWWKGERVPRCPNNSWPGNRLSIFKIFDFPFVKAGSTNMLLTCPI